MVTIVFWRCFTIIVFLKYKKQDWNKFQTFYLLNIKHFLHLLNEYLYKNRNLILMQSTRTYNKHMFLQFIIIENLAYFGEKLLFSQNVYIFNQSYHL